MKNYRVYTSVDGMKVIEVKAAKVNVSNGTVFFLTENGDIGAAFLLSQIVGFSQS